MTTLNLVNIGENFIIEGFQINNNRELENIGLYIGQVLKIKGIINISRQEFIIVESDNTASLINKFYARNIYGRTLEKGKSLMKTRG